jgi:uncharacterized membrane-anchored protein
MLLASIVGTTFGDFISTGLNFGFVKGLFPLCFTLTAIFVAEWKTKGKNEIYYWAAIVITRTVATNLADLATHGLNLDYVWLEVALFSFFAVTMLFHRTAVDRSVASSDVVGLTSTSLPNNDVRYWVMILVASTIGTTLGDFLADNLGLGVAWASILLGSILAGVFYLRRRIKLFDQAGYWGVLILIRTTGTVMGDFVSGEEGLNLGFMTSAACTALLLIGVLRLWRPEPFGRSPTEPAATTEPAAITGVSAVRREPGRSSTP